MTIASRRREASIENAQRSDGLGETHKIHSVRQRLGALKEDEAMKSPSMSGKEPVERGGHPADDAVGGRTARGQPAHHPKGFGSPMCSHWADNWEVLQQSDTMFKRYGKGCEDRNAHRRTATSVRRRRSE